MTCHVINKEVLKQNCIETLTQHAWPLEKKAAFMSFTWNFSNPSTKTTEKWHSWNSIIIFKIIFCPLVLLLFVCIFIGSGGVGIINSEFTIPDLQFPFKVTSCQISLLKTCCTKCSTFQSFRFFCLKHQSTVTIITSYTISANKWTTLYNNIHFSTVVSKLSFSQSLSLHIHLYPLLRLMEFDHSVFDSHWWW